MTTVMWLRQSPGVPNAKHLLEHIQRLKAIQLLRLPEGAEQFQQSGKAIKEKVRLYWRVGKASV